MVNCLQIIGWLVQIEVQPWMVWILITFPELVAQNHLFAKFDSCYSIIVLPQFDSLYIDHLFDFPRVRRLLCETEVIVVWHRLAYIDLKLERGTACYLLWLECVYVFALCILFCKSGDSRGVILLNKADLLKIHVFGSVSNKCANNPCFIVYRKNRKRTTELAKAKLF